VLLSTYSLLLSTGGSVADKIRVFAPPKNDIEKIQDSFNYWVASLSLLRRAPLEPCEARRLRWAKEDLIMLKLKYIRELLGSG
jgi:hypothetical protein